MSLPRKGRGFTLIEVLVALVVMGLVLGGLYIELQSQVDLRYRIQERYIGQTVSWNRLIEQYQIVNEWTPRGDALGEKNGSDEVLSREWFWQLEVQETFGEDFYRYEVETFQESAREGPSSGSLVAFFIAED